MSLRGAVGDAAIPYINVRLLRAKALAMTVENVIARSEATRQSLLYQCKIASRHGLRPRG